VQNIVPVDYVADMIAAIVTCDRDAGGIFNLVHDSPPTNDAIRLALEQALGVEGLAFGHLAGEPRTRLERIFDRMIEPIAPYFSHTPRFSRRRAASVEAREGIACPRYDLPALVRLCACARSHPRRAADAPRRPLAALAAEYFERFLPRFVPQSSVARLGALTANVRFVLTDVADGHWLCRFDAGRLAQVERSGNDVVEDFGYRVDASTFLDVVAAQLDPQEAFLSARVEVFGDVERALKMAMVLRQFNYEFPFRSGDAQPGREKAAHA
jgi:predicted lipid carrier protein YhbT